MIRLTVSPNTTQFRYKQRAKPNTPQQISTNDEEYNKRALNIRKK